MGIGIGHRGGIDLRPGHRNGLNKVTPRHGVPFHNPAEVFNPGLRLKSALTSIIFSASGKLSGGSYGKGSASITFSASGKLTNTTPSAVEAQRLRAESWIKFYATGKLSRFFRHYGVAWIVFDANANLTEAIVIEEINYGLLYNWYAADDSRNIANTGWHRATKTDYETLMSYIEPSYNNLSNTIGQKVKEAGDEYWLASGGTNDYGFNARGGGRRTSTGTFEDLQSSLNLASSERDATKVWKFICYTGTNYTASIISATSDKVMGFSIRLLKDSTTLSDGEEGTYTGNDGKIYRTICIGTQEWVADNIAETKYRNGDSIPEETDNTAWAALTTGALCAYDNDWDNV